MEKSLERKTALFIVRLWTEYLQRDPPAFRGEIEHVISKQKYYFINTEELNQFLLKITQNQIRLHEKIINDIFIQLSYHSSIKTIIDCVL